MNTRSQIRGILLMSLFHFTLSAQIEVDSGGEVGIGTTSPNASLDVRGQVMMGFHPTLGTPSLTSGFNGQFGDPLVGNSGGFRFTKNSITSGEKVFSLLHSNSGIEFYQEVLSASDSRFIFYGGNVGIGTTAPGYKLQVAGTVRATSFISNTTTYADFVFEPDYKLPSLSEVEEHIQEHGHLPGVPSEAEVAKEGIDLASMQVTLLQKIEELTLHQIAQEKRLNEQTQSIDEQTQRIESLESENTTLRSGEVL